MKPRSALTLALASALAAVGVVSVDLVFTLTGRLDTQEGPESWRTVATGPDAGHGRYAEPWSPYGGDCAGTTLRLVVDNNKPLPDTVPILIHYQARGPRFEQNTILRETWNLDAFEVREYAFTIPDSAFENLTADPNEPDFIDVYASFGEFSLSACVRQEE